MKLRLRALLGIAVLGGLAYIGFQTARNVNQIRKFVSGKEAVKALDYLPEATLRIKNFHRVSMKDGRKEWEIWGQEAKYLKDDQQAVLIDPRMSLYPESGPPISFEGREGRAFFHEQEVVKMELTGGITVQHRGLDIDLERATYDPSSQTVFSPGQVVAKGERIEVKGESMALRLAEGKMSLENGVRVRLFPRGKSER
jgi:LPS export ABC transporter protein LptC